MKNSGHVSFWVFIALSIILVVFAVQNSRVIEVTLLFKKIEISLAILLAITFLAGLIAGCLYAAVHLTNSKNEKRVSKNNPVDKENDGYTAS